MPRTIMLTYTGRVMDENTRVQIPAAKVTLHIEGVLQIDHTDNEGIYRFRVGLTHARVEADITIEANDYEKYERNLTLTQDMELEGIRLHPKIAAPVARTTPVSERTISPWIVKVFVPIIVALIGAVGPWQYVVGPILGFSPLPTPSVIPSLTPASQPTVALTNTPTALVSRGLGTATPLQTLIPTKTCSENSAVELLSKPWHLAGTNFSSDVYQDIDPNILRGKDTVRIVYNLHGTEIREGERKDESAVIFDQPNWHVISLANYDQNGLDGQQTVHIPLSDFIGISDQGVPDGTRLDPNKPVGTLHARFWNSRHFVVDITSLVVCKS